MMQEDDRAQMLLATGVVLLMSLLSMAIYGVKLAGLTMAHDTVGTEVIDSSTQIVEYLPLLVEVRADEWYAGGMSELQSVESAMSSAHDDVLHHGEIRGVGGSRSQFDVNSYDILLNRSRLTHLLFSFQAKSSQ